MKKIGIVGLGIMGSGMATNFLKNGYQLSVWNRSTDKSDDLVRQGANLLATPKAVTEASDIVFEVVSDDEASRSVWYGPDGIFAGADTDKVLITSASLSLSYLDELLDETEHRNLQFFDMPLTGSRTGAENGKLKLLVGGDQDLLEKIRPDLLAIADKIYYFGAEGSGMRFKLILNSVQAIQINAAVQAIELAKKVGLNVDDVHHAIFDAPMGAASGATNMAFQGTDDNYVNFAVSLIEKDLRYAQAMAEKYGADFDLLNDTQRDFAAAKDKGLGDQDWTKLIKIYE